MTFDQTHAALKAFLDGAVTEQGVDYTLLKTRSAQLDKYLADVAAAPFDTFSAPEQVAFDIDAYDALTISVVLGAWPNLHSITDLDGGHVWTKRTFQVGGRPMTLDALESEARTKGGPRVHAVPNCASKGCPPMPPAPIVADGLDAELDAACKHWAKTDAYRIDGDTLYLSHVFDWYAGDFANGEGNGAFSAAIAFLQKYVDDPRLKTATNAHWQDYDWSINAAASPH